MQFTEILGEVTTTMAKTDAPPDSEHNHMKNYDAHIYSAYGFAATVKSSQHLLGFNGEYAQALTSLYILGTGYRVYDTALMRFFSPDSLSPFGDGGINTYAYCTGDPVNRIDPSGHFSFLYPAKAPTAPKILLPERAQQLKLPTHPTKLATRQFSESRLNEMSYSSNQYLLRMSKAELKVAGQAIMSAPSEAKASATKHFISLENRHHQLAQGLNSKITDRYAYVIQQMMEQNLYRPEKRVSFNPELRSLIRAGMRFEVPSAYDIRTVRPPY